jgi:hypothetical protein
VTSKERRWQAREMQNRGEAVPCQVCGLRRHTLAQHLRHSHGLTTAAYRARFPGAPVASSHFGGHVRDRRADGVGGRPVVWTRESALEVLRAEPRALTVREWRGRAPSLVTLQRLFGTWRRAWRKAGHRPRRPYGQRR